MPIPGMASSAVALQPIIQSNHSTQGVGNPNVPHPSQLQSPGSSPQTAYPSAYSAYSPYPQQLPQPPHPPPRTTTLDEEKGAAWRYRGYRSFSKWMASDDDFFVVRKFGAVSARCTLLMQDRIQVLSEELEHEDNICEANRWHCGQFRDKNHRNNFSDRRLQLLDELSWRLDQYNRFILSHSKLKSRPDANKLQISNVKTWFNNNENAIRDDERAYIEEDGDLMALVPKRKVPLRRFIERYLDPITELRWFRDDERMRGKRDETTIYNKESRIDSVLTCTVVSVGVLMLLGPICLLQLGFTSGWSVNSLLGTMSGFIVLFTFLLGTVTVAQPFEVLAATAAYAAVLTFILQIAAGGPPKAH